LQDAYFTDWARALKILFSRWALKDIGDREIVLWGSERDINAGSIGLRARLINFLFRRRFINAFRMTKQDMFDYVNKINNFQPIHIRAYVESIYDLAKFIEMHDLQIHSPRSVMTSAGVLQPHVREVIENVFRAPVFNRYGSREVGDIASECEMHEGLHVSNLTHYVEIIDDEGKPTEPGEVGEIVITLLTNYSMPLIRYRIGDMGAWAKKECSCGCSWPLLKEIVGRVTGTFLLRDGTHIHGEYFTHLFYLQDWLKKFQVIQEDYDVIRVLLVFRESLMDPLSVYCEPLSEIENKIKIIMGMNCEVIFENVDQIPPSPSGKRRYTISKLL
jgi:phenylacetate-CoA ligase